MNHHFRSYSEQPVPTTTTTNNNNQNYLNNNNTNNTNNNTNNNNGNNNNRNNGFCETNTNNFFSSRNQDSLVVNNQATSTIMEHSDSQQSLDRLFNPQNNPQRPLRERDLPASFFNPNLGANQSFHHRSTSYNPTSRLQQTQVARQQQAIVATVNDNNNNGGFHHRSQSNAAPMTRDNDTITTNNQQTNGADGTTTTTQTGAHNAAQSVIANATAGTVPMNSASNATNELRMNNINNTNAETAVHQQLGVTTNNNQHHQAAASVPTPMNYHQRVFSSPHFSRPKMSHQLAPANVQYQTTQLASHNQSTQFYNNNVQHDTTASLRQPQEPPTGHITCSANTFSDSTRIGAPINQEQSYYFASSPDIALPATTIQHESAPIAPTINPYFASSDSIQPIGGVAISNSQPYVSYDSALGHSSSMLNPSCQTVSSLSSSSNEANHSMLCMPSPAVHSRSCSFGENASAQPVAHIRTQSSVAGLSSTVNGPPRAYDQYHHRDRNHHQLGLSSVMNPDVGFAEIKNEIPTMRLATNSLLPSNLHIPLSPTSQDHRPNSPGGFNDWQNNNNNAIG